MLLASPKLITQIDFELRQRNSPLKNIDNDPKPTISKEKALSRLLYKKLSGLFFNVE